MSFFCDWVTCLVELSHPTIDTGFLTKVGVNGEHIFTKDSNLSLMGTWESKVQVKSHVRAEQFRQGNLSTHLLVHGNLTKYMQGHSIFGTPDFKLCIVPAILQILEQLGLKPNDFELHKIKNADIEITRVDITCMSKIGTNDDVELYQRKFASSATHRGKPVTVSGGDMHHWGTNYIGKTSRTWTWKIYNKWHELTQGPASHSLPDYLPMRPEVIEHTKGMIRNELTMRMPELRKNKIVKLKDLTPELVKSHYINYREKITMADNIELTDKKIDSLPIHLQRTYLLWVTGRNVRSTFKTKQGYYSHRRALLEHNIDISSIKDRYHDSNVVPLVRILEVKPASVPQAFIDAGLMYG